MFFAPFNFYIFKLILKTILMEIYNLKANYVLLLVNVFFNE